MSEKDNNGEWVIDRRIGSFGKLIPANKDPKELLDRKNKPATDFHFYWYETIWEKPIRLVLDRGEVFEHFRPATQKEIIAFKMNM